MKKKTPNDMAEYITVKEVLAKVGIGKTLLYKMFKKKELTKYKIGGKTLVKISDLPKVVRACT